MEYNYISNHEMIADAVFATVKGRGKAGINRAIAGMTEHLWETYHYHRHDIANDAVMYIRRKRKLDGKPEDKIGWAITYACYNYLVNLTRKLRRRSKVVVLESEMGTVNSDGETQPCYLDTVSNTDFYDNPVYDHTDSLHYRKEIIKTVEKYFSNAEIMLMLGEITGPEAAEEDGVSYDTFKKRLSRKKRKLQGQEACLLRSNLKEVTGIYPKVEK